LFVFIKLLKTHPWCTFILFRTHVAPVTLLELESEQLERELKLSHRCEQGSTRWCLSKRDPHHLSHQSAAPGRSPFTSGARSAGPLKESAVILRVSALDRASGAAECRSIKWCGAGEKVYIKSAWGLIILLMMRSLFDHREEPWSVR